MNEDIIQTLKSAKNDFSNNGDLAGLIHQIKDKKIVMLGEASHGTHEYYAWRARISKILLAKYDFDFVAVEGDWPPCYQLNRYLKNYKDAGSSTQAVLKNFKRWPSWMWANWEIHEWAEWLRAYNEERQENNKKGFYGLDVYSLWESLDAITEYLKKEDPSALATAQKAMQCFEPYRGADGQEYAHSTRLVPEGCRSEVSAMLTEIRNRVPLYNSDKEHVFSTEQNAIVAKNAEEYYREMIQGGQPTWNLRDKHMMNTLNRLMDFHGASAKGIVWAHNTHIGDASHTNMQNAGLFNIGQLGRETYGDEQVSLIGFGSYKGRVLAGKSWGAAVEKMRLPEAREGSWEQLCHEVGKQFYVMSSDLEDNLNLQKKIPHRAVGVVFNPATEKWGNYVPTRITKRYDAFLFFNESRALNALDLEVENEKLPVTYPFGL